MKAVKLWLVLAVCALLMSGIVASAATWDAVASFSATTSANVDGVWSYGWTPNVASGYAFTLYNTSGVIWPDVEGCYVWSANGNPPLLAANVSDVLQGVYDPKTLCLFDDPAGQFSIVRWIAPSAGQYSITSSFFNYVKWPNNTMDAVVLVNGVEKWRSRVTPETPGPMGFNGILQLNAGDTVDFAGGDDSTGVGTNDGTAFTATVTAVPEPASILAMLVGLGGLISRRKK